MEKVDKNRKILRAIPQHEAVASAKGFKVGSISCIPIIGDVFAKVKES